MSRTAKELAAYELTIIENAVTHTAFQRFGPGRVRKGEFTTLDEAQAQARAWATDQGDFRKSVLVYAVDALGRDTMVGSVMFDGSWVPVPR